MSTEKKVSFQTPDNLTESQENEEERDEGPEDEKPNVRDTPIFKFFAKALGIDFSPKTQRVLDEVTFEGIAKYIREGKCKNIITMAGAGISTSAGIPDFRSPKTGVYDNLEKYKLPNPQAIFSIDYFKKDPVPFFQERKFMFLTNFKPTVCHYFIKMLNDEGLLLRHYTQNVDALDKKAGLEDDKIVEAHGTFDTGHCMECYEEYSLEWMNDIVFRDEIPRCTEDGCKGIVRPNIVMFGEPLPAKFGEFVSKDFEQCDLLIILGTSLLVQPFASLTSRVPDTAPRLYINLDKSEASTRQIHPVSELIFGGGFKFDHEDNERDVFWQGTCDDGCQRLADLIGWGDKLKDMVAKEHSKLSDKEVNVSKVTAPRKNVASGSTARSTKKCTSEDSKSSKPKRQMELSASDKDRKKTG